MRTVVSFEIWILEEEGLHIKSMQRLKEDTSRGRQVSRSLFPQVQELYLFQHTETTPLGTSAIISTERQNKAVHALVSIKWYLILDKLLKKVKCIGNRWKYFTMLANLLSIRKKNLNNTLNDLFRLRFLCCVLSTCPYLHLNTHTGTHACSSPSHSLNLSVAELRISPHVSLLQLPS